MADLGAKVTELRQAFLSKYDGSILDDTYDERDVERVKKNDGFMRAVLRSFKCSGDIKKGCDLLNDVLLFRVKYKLNDLKESDLHPELLEKKGVYFHGKDKQGNRILQFRVSQQKKGHLISEGKSYIAYHMEQHYKDHPEEPVAFLFDFVDAGISNMDMDITKFIIHCASTYFPHLASINIMFKMGTALEVIWKIIKGFLDADQSKKTHFATRKNITDYIDEDQLLPHQKKEEKK